MTNDHDDGDGAGLVARAFDSNTLIAPALSAHVRAHAAWPNAATLRAASGDQLRLYFMSLALCGEAGELANQFKKNWRGDADEGGARAAKIEDEVVDCANYVFMIADLLGIDLLPAMLDKFRAVEDRPAWKEAHK